MHSKQFIWVQCLFSAEYTFCSLNLMYIYATRYLRDAILQIIFELSCGFSLFPDFQTTFFSVVPNFKFFNQNIPNKMISKNKTSKFKNREVVTSYSKGFNREFQSNLTYFQNNIFRTNFKKLFECNKMCYTFYCKSNNNLQPHSNYGIVFNCIFWYSFEYIKYFIPSILNRAQYFPRYIEWRRIRDFIDTDTECVSLYSRILVCTVYPHIRPYLTRV